MYISPNLVVYPGGISLLTWWYTRVVYLSYPGRLLFTVIPSLFTLETPWWVYTAVVHTPRGTLVGIYSITHPERHPGGCIYQCYTPREAPWWVYADITHLGRHPGGYMPLFSLKEAPWWVYPLFSLKEAPWWVYPSYYTHERHPGGYTSLYMPLRTPSL